MDPADQIAINRTAMEEDDGTPAVAVEDLHKSFGAKSLERNQLDHKPG